MPLARPSELPTRAVKALIPYARNSRTHSDDQVRKIAASIEEFGFTNPVLIDADGGIIAGHGRVMAAAKLGLTEVPVLVLDHLTEAGFNVELTGFSLDEIDAIMAVATTDGLTDPDEVPEPPNEPVSRLGDVWIMGRHRIVCGDSTDADTVAKALNGVTPHLMVTDPPYGVEYDADWRNKAIRSDGTPVAGRAVGKVLNDDRADWREAWALFPGDVAYVWHNGLFAGAVADSLEACDFQLRSQIIWAKTRFAIGRGDYHWQHEPCWYAVKKGGKGHGNGDRTQSTLWQISHSKSETGHSTQKPVECMKRPIENNSSPGQAVYEPFSGSGTTIIAGEITGRSVHAIELNPAYVDVAVKRWEEFTGRDAVHGASGKTFSEMRQSRAISLATPKDVVAGRDGPAENA